MRGEYDLYQSKYDAEGEHFEFKRHCCPDADCDADTIALPGLSGSDAPTFRRRAEWHDAIPIRPQEAALVRV